MFGSQTIKWQYERRAPSQSVVCVCVYVCSYSVHLHIYNALRWLFFADKRRIFLAVAFFSRGRRLLTMHFHYCPFACMMWYAIPIAIIMPIRLKIELEHTHTHTLDLNFDALPETFGKRFSHLANCKQFTEMLPSPPVGFRLPFAHRGISFRITAHTHTYTKLLSLWLRLLSAKCDCQMDERALTCSPIAVNGLGRSRPNNANNVEFTNLGIYFGKLSECEAENRFCGRRAYGARFVRAKPFCMLCYNVCVGEKR